MTVHNPQALFAEARIVPAPVLRNRADRVFDLHPALFGATIAAYAAFLLVMGAAFMNPELWLPFAIFAVYLGMAFAVPGWWARVAPAAKGRLQSWAEFLDEGVETGSGHLTAKAAIAQMMTVPALIVAWGLAIAVIRASV